MNDYEYKKAEFEKNTAGVYGAGSENLSKI